LPPSSRDASRISASAAIAQYRFPPDAVILQKPFDSAQLDDAITGLAN
jgi:hypothetical protein